jgi:hypothetical protein
VSRAQALAEHTSEGPITNGALFASVKRGNSPNDMAEANYEETSPSSSSNDEQGQIDPPKFESRISRLQRYAFRKFPSWIPDPDYRRMLELSRGRDGDDNEQTQPPVDEFVDFRCIWGVEFYTASHIGKLLESFAQLGWNKDYDSTPGGDPGFWIRRQRETPYGGGWFNLGVIARPGEKRFFGTARRAALPEYVELAHGSLFSLTSSITCIVVGFLVNEEYSRCFDSALRQTYETYFEPQGRGYQIHRPTNQKRAKIQALRSEIRTSIAKWFSAHLPGLCSSRPLTEFPTCEFVTLKTGLPFPRLTNGAHAPQYLAPLNLSHDFDAWGSTDIPGVKFAWSVSRGRDEQFHAIIAANENEMDKDQLQLYGGATRSCYLIYVDNHIQVLLTRWALLTVVAGFERHLNTIRDSASYRPNGRQTPLQLLRSISHLVSSGMDIAAVSAEMIEFTKDKRLFDYNVATFKPCNPQFYRNQNITLSDQLRKTVKERMAWLGNTDFSLRGLLTQYGTIVGVQENIRLQRSVNRLTLLIAVLTVLMLYFAAAQSGLLAK